MSSLGLIWDSVSFSADLGLAANDLVTDDGLETAVLRALFEDRRAEASDVLPPGVTSRRGWWGDAFPVVAGDKVGSRLWLLERETVRPDVLARAERYSREALQWLLDDKVAESIDVAAELLGASGYLLTITIHRPGRDPARFRFGRAWQAQARN